MNLADQTVAIQTFGYTHAEASFIVTAALHAGYFLRRQFSPNRGKRADELCRKLLRNQHASVTVYAQNTQLYHLHAKPLYCAMGQDDNRHRRRKDPFSLRAKLMGLDYVLARPQLRFLPTEQSKCEYFLRERNLPPRFLPTKTYTAKNGAGTTVRFFIEKYPVWVDPLTERVGLGYMDDGVFTPPSFPTWLRQHYALISEIGAVDVVYISVSSKHFVAGANAWGCTLGAVSGTIGPELQAYFELRFDVETRGLAGRTQESLDRYRKLTRRFADRKFQEQYAAWKAGAKPGKHLFPRPERERSGPAFSTCHLDHSYRLFSSSEMSKTEKPRGAKR